MGKGKAIAGFVLSLVSIVLGFAFGSISCLIMAIVGLCLSTVGGKQLRMEETVSGRNFATAGVALGIVSVVLNGIATVVCGIIVAVVGRQMGEWQSFGESLIEYFL